MASSRYENMWGLMSLHTFIQDPDTINDNLSCVICKNLMIDACHSTCGCQYCHKCISDYLRDGDRYCPGDKDACKEELLVLERDVNKNREMNIKISNLKVLCQNQSCQHKIELIKMEEHLRDCPKQPISCPYSTLGCDEVSVARDTIVAHLHDGMMTHSTKLIDCIIDFKNELDNLKNKAQVTELEMSAMKEELRMKNFEIRDLNEEMENTKEILENRIVTLERESTDNSEQIRDLDQELTDLNNDNASTRDELSRVKNSLVALDTKYKKCRTEILTKLIIMKGAYKRKRTMSSASSLSEPRPKVNRLDATIGSTSNPFQATKVTVDGLSGRISAEAIFSPYFYSHNNGYKLRLIIYTTRWARYLYVSLIICKGEYDDLLQWPCEYSFDISIVNQFNGRAAKNVTVNYASIDEASKYMFDKPSNKDNNRYKCMTLSYAKLRSLTGAILNDSVVVKCNVRQ